MDLVHLKQFGETITNFLEQWFLTGGRQ